MGARGEIVKVMTRQDTVSGTVLVEVEYFLW